jgi:hypothetical protein
MLDGTLFYTSGQIPPTMDIDMEKLRMDINFILRSQLSKGARQSLMVFVGIQYTHGSVDAAGIKLSKKPHDPLDRLWGYTPVWIVQKKHLTGVYTKSLQSG